MGTHSLMQMQLDVLTGGLIPHSFPGCGNAPE